MKNAMFLCLFLLLAGTARSQEKKYPQKLDNDICTNLIIGDFACKGCAASDKDLPNDVRDDVVEILQSFKYCKVLNREKLAEIIKTGDSEEGIGSLNAEQRSQLRQYYQADRILFGNLKVQSNGSLLITVEINNLATADQEGYKRFTVPANKFEDYDSRHPFIEKGMVSMLLGSSDTDKPAGNEPPPSDKNNKAAGAEPQASDTNTKPATPATPTDPAQNGTLIWQHTTGAVSVWKVDPDGAQVLYREHKVGTDWTLLSCSGNKVLWRHNTGKISLWTLGTDGIVLKYKEHGPIAGWTALNYADGKILWRHTTGKVSLWTIDDDGNQLSYKEHGPFNGWTAQICAGGNLIWQHSNGKVSVWKIDANGNQTTFKEHVVPVGWNLVSCAGNKVLWRHSSGKVSLWTLDAYGNLLRFKEHGPIGGWTAVSYGNQKLLWRHSSGKISLWTLDEEDNQLHFIEHGPIPGWTALIYGK